MAGPCVAIKNRLDACDVANMNALMVILSSTYISYALAVAGTMVRRAIIIPVGSADFTLNTGNIQIMKGSNKIIVLTPTSQPFVVEAPSGAKFDLGALSAQSSTANDSVSILYV